MDPPFSRLFFPNLRDRTPFRDEMMMMMLRKNDDVNTTQTTYLFLQWCKEQQIVPGQFLLALYCVLDKAIPMMMMLRKNDD